MKTRYLLSALFVLVLCFPVAAQTWSDGFETYATGSFPSAWVRDGNATDTTANYVTTAAFWGGAKSLRLYGTVGGCWAAIAYHPLSVTAPFELEVAIRNGNEALSGCNPDRAIIHLRQGTSWTNPARTLMHFKGNGNINSAAGNVLQTYTTLTWYTVKIRYERPSPTQVRVSYWINGIYKGVETLTAQAQEDQMTNLELSALEGTVWFDDAVVSPIQQSAWQDGFETYATGSFPSAWVRDGNATDTTANYVTTAAFWGGAKSLRLYGTVGGCWAAIAYHPLSVTAPFELEVAIRNGNEALSGCNPDRAIIHLRQGTSWTNPARTLMHFKGNGNINSAAGNVLQTYTTLTWYTIKIRYERPSPTQVRVSYWINGIYKGVETLTAQAQEDQMTNLELSALEGTVWFDDAVVSPIQQSAWQDGFETYATGSFPSAWVRDGNATDTTANYVTTAAFWGGAKSLRLYGTVGGCWAAIAYHPLSVTAPFELEVAIRNGNEALSGCNPDRAIIHLRQGTSWTNPARTLMHFKGNGNINSAAGNVLQTYTTLTWYTIKIRYERPSPTQVRVSYWINGIYKGVETLTAQAQEDQMTNLELSALEGTVWFDDAIITSRIVTSVDITSEQTPISFTLYQNYPNPFNPSTTIRFTLKERSNVKLVVYNILGQIVSTLVNQELGAGEYQTPFSSRTLASGIYIYRLNANGFEQSRRMLILK